MPLGPQMLEDVEEPMLAGPATLRDPGTPDQKRDGTAESNTFPEPALLQDVRRIPKGDIENKRKSMQLCLNFCLTTGTLVTEALCRSRASS